MKLPRKGTMFFEPWIILEVFKADSMRWVDYEYFSEQLIKDFVVLFGNGFIDFIGSQR
jgi:hypothetical protein